MNRILLVVILLSTVGILGCETAKDATTAGGKVVGQTADVVGGVTEGAAEGYKGKDVTADNPYGR